MSLHKITLRDDAAGPAFLAEQEVAGILADAGIDSASTIRVHVPGRGEGGSGEGRLRSALEPVVPALQSVSLFGDQTAVVLLDAHQLTVSEGEALAELVAGADPEAVVLVVVAAGRLPASLDKALSAAGADTIAIKPVRDRDAADWLANEARRRRLRIDQGARAALLEAFGTDLASMAGALDQLEAADAPLDAASLAARFRNRPEEPMWRYLDAVLGGDADTALRRLGDFLTHGHPLQLLAGLERDARRRAVAVEEVSPQAFADRIGGKADWRSQRDHERARALGPEGIEAELAAIARAERILKTEPEATHRVTMERLTVALARRGRRR
ncbi:MAG: DNA polymerase III subunit delta [Acidimicrobiia bacterium]